MRLWDRIVEKEGSKGLVGFYCFLKYRIQRV
jgi:hypothetical protein